MSLLVLIGAACSAKRLPAAEFSASMLQTRAGADQLSASGAGGATRTPAKSPEARTRKTSPAGTANGRTSRTADSTRVAQAAPSAPAPLAAQALPSRPRVDQVPDETTALTMRTSRQAETGAPRTRGMIALLLSVAAAVGLAYFVSRRHRPAD